MKVIILDHCIKVRKVNSDESYPIGLEKIFNDKCVLDWHIDNLKKEDIKYYYIGGYHIEKVIEKYNNFLFNYERDNEIKIKSIYEIIKESNEDCIIIQSNMLFKEECINKIISNNNKNCIGITKECLDESFKNNKIIINNNEWYYGGISYISKDKLSETVKLMRESMKNNFEVSLLQWINEVKWSYEFFEVGKHVINIKNKMDIPKFILGTKAKTLESLRKLVGKSEILEQISFKVKEWYDDDKKIYNRICEKYKDKFIVVRSSSLNEDSWETSNAGKFESCLNIEVNNKLEVYEAIKKVINSYNSKNEEDEVLIQEYVNNSIMSGVLFTRHIDDFSPYYVINYDDKSGLTDTVTGGTGEEVKSKLILRTNNDIEDYKIKKVVEAAKEIEDILGYDGLDIEFILTKENLYIVQVRPLAKYLKEKIITDDDIYSEIKSVERYVSNLMNKKSYISGKTTILGSMPDWNPAELIGNMPRPLALTLYQKLITNGIWAVARAEIGYKELGYNQLVYSLTGKPYVDVRKSFNSFLPSGLTNEVAEKIIDFKINKLRENKYLHDKVEFNISKSIYDFNYSLFEKELIENNFKKSEVDEFKKCLKILTNNIFNNIDKSLEIQNQRIKQLEINREKIEKDCVRDKEEIPFLINLLINDCIYNGVLPFSILARYAFISMSFLKTLVENNVLSNDEYNEILLSIPTIATKFTEDNDLLLKGKISKEEFLNKYGHLRPNTYDINSLNYKFGYDTYFNGNGKNIDIEYKENNIDTIFENKKEAINNILKDNDLNFDYKALKEFIKETIPGREWAKFEYTKNINLILELIAIFGQEYSLTRDDMSYLSIDKIISLSIESHSCSLEKELKREIEYRKKKYSLGQLIKMPSIISNEKDISEFFIEESNPNFITSKNVTGEIVKIDAYNIDTVDIRNKIVVIEYADPGYDWIFGYDIKGLITKYGGVASHMSIRCAEFGIPAAIGCGDIIFNNISNSSSIELNCENNQIKVIK